MPGDSVRSVEARGVRLRCTVRGCGRELGRAGATWRCAAGHAFDVARSGYVNLLQPGDRRSLAAGDAPEAVRARERLEARGIGARLGGALVAGLAEALDAGSDPALRAPGFLLDAGAGTGFLLERAARTMERPGCALDLSADACDRGARAHKELCWIVANADRTLPFFDASAALVISSVGPKHPAEFRRVLHPAGRLALIVNAPDDLIELRAAVQGEGRLLDRAAPALERFQPHFELERRESVHETHALDREALADVLAATYRGARERERERFEALDSLTVTFGWELLWLRPAG